MRRRSRHESERGVEVAPNPLVRDSHVPQIVRIVDLEPVRGRIAAEILSARGETPDADQKVLVASKMRRRVREVGAAQPAPGAAQRIAHGRDGADP